MMTMKRMKRMMTNTEVIWLLLYCLLVDFGLLCLLLLLLSSRLARV